MFAIVMHCVSNRLCVLCLHCANAMTQPPPLLSVKQRELNLARFRAWKLSAQSRQKLFKAHLLHHDSLDQKIVIKRKNASTADNVQNMKTMEVASM